ncbi:MAG: endolytic transglycosylase MltG [Proteocatella sp.]
MKKNIFAVIILSFMFVFTGCSGADKLAAIDSTDNTEIVYELESGSSVTSISKELEDLGYIRSSKEFRKYATENDMVDIKAGTYIIMKSMPATDILKKFVDGDDYKGIKLLVPEGFEAVQIAQKIEESGLGSKEKFMEIVRNPGMFSEKYDFLNDEKIQSLEGYLFPLTYHFKEGIGEEEIADQMLHQFDIVYEKSIKPNMGNTNLSLNDVVVLASVVEREAAIEEEMPLVASVFLNRIDIDMSLQSCATVQYILGERKPILSSEDISIDSPYNTYKYKGLPVTAIASPGEKAIMSVLEPADTKYIYFLSKNDGSGEQVYSETYEEHLKNKEKYLGN